MNKCTEVDIQEMLPDLLHGTLDADARARVEAHLATCEACAEDLEVLRAVKSAAVFIPAIDVNRVVRQIPPYRTIAPAVQVPARSRVVSWLVAASLAVVVLGGGSLLMIQQKPFPKSVAIGDHRGPRTPVPLPGGTAKSNSSVASKPPAVGQQHTHALALGTGVDGLSDSNLRQLMSDMNSFDALPTTEPEPVISVDNGDSLDQSSR
jgi:hypothetical protein